MDEGSEKKIRRKKGNKKSRQESDLELGAEATSDTTRGEKDDVWIEQENVTDEKLKKREKNRKENKTFEGKLWTDEKKSNISDEIQVETPVIEEAPSENNPDEEVATNAEDNLAEVGTTSKKKRFNFKLTNLNPLKKRKKIISNDDKRKPSEETLSTENVKDGDSKSGDDEHKESESQNKAEETLDEAEKSEAENVFHELPSANSGEKKEEGPNKKLSAKEKLKQKLDKKKSSEREPARLLRHLSTQSSRLEDRLKEEDQDAQTAFDRHDVAMKVKREKQKEEITADDAYDFFTGTFDECSTEPTAIPRRSVSEAEGGEGGGSEGSEDSEERKRPSQHYIGSEYEWEVTEWTGPDIVPYRLQLERETELYFTPSPLAPSLEDILQQPGVAVSPEEEGLYTGKFPALQTGNINKMENRILEERKHNPDKTAQWFSKSGKLTRQTNPLMKHGMRPGEEEQEPLTTFVAAVPSEAEQNLISSMALQEGSRPCQLELDIASLVFSHHHLFSLEHYMTRRLTDLYHKYANKRRNNAVQVLTDKLRTLYEESSRVEEHFKVATDDELQFQKKRLTSYRTEIKAIRKERDVNSRSEKELIKSILSSWKDLRELRKKQNFTITGHKLSIHKEQTNIEEDERAWKYELDQEYLERFHEFEESKEVNLKEYEKELENWKTLHSERKEVRQRHKKHQKDMEKGRGSIDAKLFADDEELLAKPEPEKPKPPRELNELREREEIENNARENRRHPGEPKLFLELQLNGRTTRDADIYDNRELNRRNAVSKTKIFFKIFFNGKEVCQSSLKLIGQDFIIPIGQIFPIQIVHWPENIKIQIVEGSTLRTSLLAEVHLPIPDSVISLDKAEAADYEFSSSQDVAHGHAGLGSGRHFSSLADNSKLDSDVTRGQLYVRLGWGRDQQGGLLAPPQELLNSKKKVSKLSDHITEVFDSEDRVDAEKLEDWLLNHRIDPNDPRNAELMSSLSVVRGESGGAGLFSHCQEPVLKDEGHFRLDQMEDQFSFCSESEIRNNIRYQLLQLRKAKAPEFRNYCMIPPLEKEIPKGIIESYSKKIEMSKKEVVGSSDPLRGKHKLYLEQVRAQVSHKFSIAKHKKRREDVVIEDAIPDLTTLFMMLGGIAPAQRPLRPVRTERKKVTIQDLSGQDVKLLLCVVRAYDVPVRHDTDPVSSVPAGQSNSGPRESIVRSFVEASFQQSTARTVVADGPNPTWNQNMELSFKPPNNDFSPENMKKVQDCLHLHLFDEVKVDILEDERERSSKIHQRIENKWLGSLSIPFSSLYQNTRIEGTFRLHSPPVLLGYSRLGQSLQQHLGWRPNTPTTPTDSGSGEKDATFLNIYLTIQPALNAPEPVREKLDCEETDDVLACCSRWSSVLSSAFSHRKLNPLVIDVEGKAVLMTRYIRAIAPPRELMSRSEEVSTAQLVAWFVSLIPYVPSNAYFPGLGDIWPDSDKFLQMMAGTEAEHAVLLTNYLTGMNKAAYLVLGYGIPEGRTSYVLTFEENGEHWLWNATTGEHFVTTETFCPLTGVFAVLNSTNMWGNLQQSDQPQRLRWELGNGSDWVALFPGGVAPSHLTSLQPDSLHLAPVDHRGAKQLKDKIEKSLRDTIMNLRRKANLRTSLNFQGKAILSKLLPGLEAARLSSVSSRGISQEHLSELQRIITSHKVCGFPLHFAYSDLESILEGVRGTGVHLNTDPGVEFALSVLVEPYPNSVMSVWVYVASIVRRR